MYKNGAKLELCIDSNIVTKHKKLIYAIGNESCIWPILIQKAFAKLHGGYDALQGIQACEAMRDLTGAPAYTYDVNKENLVNDLVDYNDKKYVMVCSKEGDHHSILDVQKI